MFSKHNWALALSAFALGALASLGYNGTAQVLLGFVGLIGFTYLLTSHSSTILITSSFAFGYFLTLLYWIRIVGFDAWFGLSLLMTGFWLIAALVIRFFNIKTAYGLATIFTGFELLRDRFPWGGFGWGQFGVWAVDVPLLSKIVPLLGQSALTWLIFYGAVLLWKSRSRFIKLSIAVLLLGVSAQFWTFATKQVEPLKLAAVQGGVVNYGLGTSGQPGVVFEKHLKTTIAAESKLNNLDLVVWPESAIDKRLDSSTKQQLQELASELNSAILINTVEEISAKSVGNHSYLVQPTSANFVYAKQRLVPFGEFLPLRSQIEALTERASLMPRDFVAGESAIPNGFDYPLVICFEIADDQIAAAQPANQILFVQTNNATYQNTNQTEQQLFITRFRALELQTPILTVSTSGVSAFIDSDGQVVNRLEQGEESVILAQTSGLISSTTARTLNKFVPWAILFGMIFVSARARKVQL